MAHKQTPADVQRERPDCITPRDISRLRAASRFSQAEFEAWYAEMIPNWRAAGVAIPSKGEALDVFAAHR